MINVIKRGDNPRYDFENILNVVSVVNGLNFYGFSHVLGECFSPVNHLLLRNELFPYVSQVACVDLHSFLSVC